MQTASSDTAAHRLRLCGRHGLVLPSLARHQSSPASCGGNWRPQRSRQFRSIARMPGHERRARGCWWWLAWGHVTDFSSPRGPLAARSTPCPLLRDPVLIQGSSQARGPCRNGCPPSSPRLGTPPRRLSPAPAPQRSRPRPGGARAAPHPPAAALRVAFEPNHRPSRPSRPASRLAGPLDWPSERDQGAARCARGYRRVLAGAGGCWRVPAAGGGGRRQAAVAGVPAPSKLLADRAAPLSPFPVPPHPSPPSSMPSIDRSPRGLPCCVGCPSMHLTIRQEHAFDCRACTARYRAP